MLYLVFKPYRKRVSSPQEHSEVNYRYDFRNQSFIGYTNDLNEALKICHDNLDLNYQVYECQSDSCLEFKMKNCTRYGFRKHTDFYVPYRRVDDGKETYMTNPFIDQEENQRRLDAIRNKKLEGLRQRRSQLADLEQKIRAEAQELDKVFDQNMIFDQPELVTLE